MFFRQPLKLTGKTLQKYVDLVYHGDRAAFAHDIARHPDTVRHWCTGHWQIAKQDEIKDHMVRLARFYGQRNFDIEKELGE